MSKFLAVGLLVLTSICPISSLPRTNKKNVAAKMQHPNTIVIAGAGPASLLFARRYLGLHPDAYVHIYEKRQKHQGNAKNNDEPAPAAASRIYDPAFGFGIGRRARETLRKAGGDKLVNAVCNKAVKTPTELWMVNRADMCEAMTKDLLAACKKRVQITYGAEVMSLQKQEQKEADERGNKPCTAKIKFDNGETEHVSYALLVAADGSNSSVRKDLVAKRLVKEQKYRRPVNWKVLQLPAQPDLPSGSVLDSPPPHSEQFGAVMPRHPNRFFALLFWSDDLHTNPFNATTPEELKEAMKVTFPAVTDFPSDDELDAFLATSKPGHEYYMKLDRHAIDELHVALIGDAATGSYSTLGQGCACAFQSANCLAEKLEASDTVTALQAFSRERTREGHSLTDLNLVAHLTYSKWLSRLGLLSSAREISVELNDPWFTYSELLEKFRWQVELAKMYWLVTRRTVVE